MADIFADRTRYRRPTAVLLACVLPACAALTGCSRPAPEQALRETLGRVQAAIEARDAGAVADALAEDFIGPGGLDRDGARRMAALHFMRHREVGVVLGPLDIELQEDHARVLFDAMLTGGQGRPLPDRVGGWEVDTGWRLVDGEWRMISADWSPALR